MVLAAQIEKTRYVKAKLIRDLPHGRRLFVFKGEAHDDSRDCRRAADIRSQQLGLGLRRGYRAFAGVGGAALRWADAWVRQSLRDYDGDSSLPVKDWVAVCANAYRIAQCRSARGARLQPDLTGNRDVLLPMVHRDVADNPRAR